MQDALEGLDTATKVGVVNLLNDMYAREVIQAEIEQEEIARANQELGPRRVVDGLGEQTMSVHPTIYWAHRIGAKRSWNDSDWRNWMLRRHPQLRVQNAPAQTRIGPKQFSAAPTLIERVFGAATSRFHKRYAT